VRIARPLFNLRALVLGTVIASFTRREGTRRIGTIRFTFLCSKSVNYDLLMNVIVLTAPHRVEKNNRSKGGNNEKSASLIIDVGQFDRLTAVV
jgi:hypothetical protein